MDCLHRRLAREVAELGDMLNVRKGPAQAAVLQLDWVCTNCHQVIFTKRFADPTHRIHEEDQ